MDELFIMEINGALNRMLSANNKDFSALINLYQQKLEETDETLLFFFYGYIIAKLKKWEKIYHDREEG